jgi:hypothetical protein
MTPNEPIIYPSLGVRVRRSGAGWLIEQFNDDGQWQRVGSSVNTARLLDHLGRVLEGLPVSKEAWATLTDIAADEVRVAQPGRGGLNFLRNVPTYNTDFAVPRHEAGRWAPSASKPTPMPRPPVPEPATPDERRVFDPTALREEMFQAAERLRQEVVEAVTEEREQVIADARAKLRGEIEDVITKAMRESEQPILIDAEIEREERLFREARAKGDGAAQRSHMMIADALRTIRAGMVYRPAVIEPKAEEAAVDT